MDATQRRRRATVVAPVRLRREIFDALAKRKGAETHDEVAELLSLHRTTVIELRGGRREASLGTAMHIARFFAKPVERLFERVENTDSAAA